MRVVAVFGGGGAKSLAHIGAQRALVEAGLTPFQYIGTSFGAVMGAAFAAGVSAESVATAVTSRRDTVVSVDIVSLFKGFFADHFLKAEPLRGLIAALVPATRFDELKTPLTVTATDLDSGAAVRFGAGGRNDIGLRDALYASCALPLYFPPARIGGRRYGDGGLRAVLPLEAAAAVQADLVVAIHVGPGFDEPDPPPVKGRFPPALIRAHGESERIMMAAQVERTIAAWPVNGAKLVLVRAVREREATFAVANARRYIEAGYQTTKEALGTSGMVSGKSRG
jgi:NTE family protein